jgi:hypothetical protein
MAVLVMKFDLEWAFTSYADGFLQDMMTVLRELHGSGITIEDILAYGEAEFAKRRLIEYESRKALGQMMEEFKYKIRRCGLCGNPMRLEPVNNSPCTQVGGELQSVWTCINFMDCGEQVFSNLSVLDEAERYGLGRYFRTRQAAASTPARRRRAAAARSGRRPERKPCCGNR